MKQTHLGPPTFNCWSGGRRASPDGEEDLRAQNLFPAESNEGRRRAVVEELARFEDVGSAVRSLGSVATREKTEGARRRRRRVRESLRGDGECAFSWQTNEKLAALILALTNVS
eukprot:941495-Pleurochrysis_carterae.AAC.2